MESKRVGQTAATGFQVGVRRTLNVSPEQAWDYLVSRDGLKVWLGSLSPDQLQPKVKYESREGISGEMRIVKPPVQLRMTWKKSDWEKPSTLQIRLIGSNGPKTTISLHQENLSDHIVREDMKRHWEDVLLTIKGKLS